MALLEWSDGFLLGIKEVDDHHKHLVGLLNISYDAYKNGAPANRLATVIKELIDYSGYHFSAEEYWMTKHSYPTLAEHKDEHESFSRKVGDFQKNLLDGNANLSVELFTFLANWVRTHILETDALFGRYIASRENSRCFS